MADGVQSAKVKVARIGLRRLRGLLFERSVPHTLALPACNDIHTFGMSFCIDVALVAPDGKVLGVCRNLAPCCRVRDPAAWGVLERQARSDERWYEVGDQIEQDVLEAMRERAKR